ncbi:TIGR01777 family oxidoreductase [Shewanella glacialimarina]|uniref:TIGR01777 family oxidoreductase n=1 Tax=Shewanella glacialimarina TaxID=2590884 RepID=UPI001CF8DE7A|nr:TIGR01777 family oxidoreductase [Shewanella glacialimarina]UCX05103.1 TIGR01777 family protein [Shewanella glacialimarina]
MNILITGATGFVGKHLVAKLTEHKLTVLSRDINHAAKVLGTHHTFIEDISQLSHLNNFDAVINLAGEPIVAKRWTKNQKIRICHSRWDITQNLSQLIASSQHPPKTFISASAIGYYGRQGQEPVDEHSQFHDEFSHQICQKWEQLALEADSSTTRVCIPRIGIVLGKNGGALSKMLPPFKLGLGGPIGKGKQGMSWIHQDDLVALIIWMLTTPTTRGIYNATAPNPVSNAEFSSALGKALNRPAKIIAPPLALRLAMGEMSELLTEGQYVLPSHALSEGFTFKFTDVNSALAAIV